MEGERCRKAEGGSLLSCAGEWMRQGALLLSRAGIPIVSPSQRKTDFVAGIEPLNKIPFVERSFTAKWRRKMNTGICREKEKDVNLYGDESFVELVSGLGVKGKKAEGM